MTPNPKGFFGLMVGLALLGAAACSSPKPEEAFIQALENDFADGRPVEEIILKLMSWDYPGQEDPAQALIERYRPEGLDEMERSNAELEAETLRLAELIRANRCAEIFQMLETNYVRAPGSREELLGIFHKEGICTEENPARAAEYFEHALAKGSFAASAAHLGALYLAGEGVARDEDKAKRLFRQAVVWRAYLFLGEAPVPVYGLEFLDRTDSQEYFLWRLTPREMEKGFARIETGPWNLPDELQEQIRWMEAIGKGSDADLIAVARALAGGEEGFILDPEGALGLLDVAYRSFGNREAGFLSAAWPMDPAFCEKRRTFDPALACETPSEFTVDRMIELAFDGYPEAVTFLLDHYSKHLTSRRDRWALYEAFLLADRFHLATPSYQRNQVLQSLKDFEQKLIEGWVSDDPSFSITHFVPKPEK